MFDLSIQGLLSRAAAAFVVAGVYGLVLAYTAIWLGDRGPKYDGRLSANPLRHIDLSGFLAMWLFQQGWIRPVDIRPKGTRLGGASIVILAVVGVVALALLAITLSAMRTLAVRHLTGDATFVTLGIVDAVIVTSIGTAVLNLVPIPPLFAGLLWRSVNPRIAGRLEAWSRVASVVLLVVLWSGVAAGVLTRAHEMVESFLGLA